MTLTGIARRIGFLASVGMACGGDGGGGGTTNPPPITAPSARGGHRMVYDEARQQVVLFGGFADGAANGETWTWDGAAWIRRSTTGPLPRVEPLMGYDAARQRVVLVGQDAGDTWEWDGTAWTQRTTSGPPARRHAGAGYDRRRSRFVVHGGLTPNDATLRDTWEWDGTAWAQRATTTPSARDLPSQLAYDETRQALVMLVGDQNAGQSGLRPTELWQWDGTSWTAVGSGSPTLSPPGALASFGSQGLMRVAGTNTIETWRWNGQSWAIVSGTNPPFRFLPGLAFDAARGRLVLFGGDSGAQAFGDTWLFDGTRWTEVR